MKPPQCLVFPKAKDVPNSRLPVLLYRKLLPYSKPRKADTFRRAFKTNGWAGIWTDTIYDYTHFHSNAHEVLGIAEGKVALKLGGDTGRLVRLRAGDMLVLPAGTGHRRVGGDEGLKVVGAYPRGESHFDMKRTGSIVPSIALPKKDPFSGKDGALTWIWMDQ